MSGLIQSLVDNMLFLFVNQEVFVEIVKAGSSLRKDRCDIILQLQGGPGPTLGDAMGRQMLGYLWDLNQ